MHYIFRMTLLFLVVIGYKIIVNSWYLRKIKAFAKDHSEYIRALGKGKGTQSWDFVKKCTEIKALFLKAGISNQKISWMEPAGLGFAQPQSASVFENISANNVEIQSKVIDAFHRSEGVFESRRRDAINPFYWVDALLHLPAHVLSYIGIKGSAWGKVADVIGWVVGILAFVTSLPDFADFQKSISHYLVIVVSWFR